MKDIVKLKIRKNDLVQVIAGKEKGKTGKVVSINEKTHRIVVEKTNMVKRHVKPTQQSPGGGITEKESALHFSNVQLMCPKCNRGVRFGIKATKTKTGILKSRFCKKCDSDLELSSK